MTFTLKSGKALCRVPFTREDVENQARLLVERGFSLIDKRGKHWVWNQCYNVLEETKTRTLIVISSIRDYTSVKENSLVIKLGINKRRGRNIVRNRVIEGD